MFVPTAFTVISSAVALLDVQTFKLNFEVILYITYFLFCKAQEAPLNPRLVFQNPLCKHTDFVFAFKSILNFRVRAFWPQNYGFDSFIVQAGHLVFLQGNQRKNSIQTVSTTSLSPGRKNSKLNGLM